jgi:hypothetical protein
LCGQADVTQFSGIAEIGQPQIQTPLVIVIWDVVLRRETPLRK